MKPNHLPLWETHVTITVLEWLVSKWGICLKEIPEEKHLKLSNFNQIYVPLATLSVPQHFGFFWIPAAKAPHLQGLAGHLRPRSSSGTQDRAFPKNWSCIQILDMTLVLVILSAILLPIKSSVASAFYKLIFLNSFKWICSSKFGVINFLPTFTTPFFSYTFYIFSKRQKSITFNNYSFPKFNLISHIVCYILNFYVLYFIFYIF